MTEAKTSYATCDEVISVNRVTQRLLRGGLNGTESSAQMNEYTIAFEDIPQALITNRSKRSPLVVPSKEIISMCLPDTESSEATTQVYRPIKCSKAGRMDQDHINQLMDAAEFADSKGMYADSVQTYQQLLNLYADEMSRCESKHGATNRGPHTGWILSCFNLTRCYLKLKRPQAAFETLQQAWRPDSSLAIPSTHPNYLELSHLYFEVEDRLQSISHSHANYESESDVRKDEFTTNELLNLICVYAEDFLSQEKSHDAISLLEGGRKRIAEEQKVIDKKMKEQIIRIHLLLVEAYLHIGQLKEGEEILNQVWNPESRFYIDTLDKNYLWMSQLYRRAINKQQCDPTSCSHQAQEQRQRTLYEKLALTRTADAAVIKSRWKLCEDLINRAQAG
ncbi:uncharacterized protein MELLADRAFT_66548 [Melampsora larici-populina 98AG31]|uniref:Uncharacterized protein n=1 Tax=Melampsora larici-populina (strain 98AG31 / pathotype 3-4-7) TaxID=747676 RepID=F4RZP5_MELLP|nr:uncharacterized protein MELLADRAFT_66548 [Melampsora larici-populina 98AG31]EGG02036.1 hypothetical protein MELLADRAFT_66548 [Melampsora larici-populina 98AG31]